LPTDENASGEDVAYGEEEESAMGQENPAGRVASADPKWAPAAAVGVAVVVVHCGSGSPNLDNC